MIKMTGKKYRNIKSQCFSCFTTLVVEEQNIRDGTACPVCRGHLTVIGPIGLTEYSRSNYFDHIAEAIHSVEEEKESDATNYMKHIKLKVIDDLQEQQRLPFIVTCPVCKRDNVKVSQLVESVDSTVHVDIQYNCIDCGHTR